MFMCGIEEPLGANASVLELSATGKLKGSQTSGLGLNRYSFVCITQAPNALVNVWKQVSLAMRQPTACFLTGSSKPSQDPRVSAARLRLWISKARGRGWEVIDLQSAYLAIREQPDTVEETFVFAGYRPLVIVSSKTEVVRMIKTEGAESARLFAVNQKFAPTRSLFEWLTAHRASLAYVLTDEFNRPGWVIVTPRQIDRRVYEADCRKAFYGRDAELVWVQPANFA
jgi:hypothetical protein